MRIDYHKNFGKKYRKLPKKIQQKVDGVIEEFQNNPLSPRLKNHPLKGAMKGRRAISVTGDLRIIFREYDDYILVLMLDVGTHTQVY